LEGKVAMSQDWQDLVLVFLFGALVGLGELLARYRDEPRRAIVTSPAMLYIAINGFASVFALIAIVTFGWVSDSQNSPEAQRLLRVLLAGFGAMAVFRTSLFSVRVGTNDIGVGPVAFLQILLGATDRGVDRKRASDRAEKVVRIMGKLNFDAVYKALPAFAMMLMQNLQPEDQKAIGDQVKDLSSPDADMPPQTKVLNLGLLLMNFVGEEVLEDAVRGIRGQLPSSTTRLPDLGKAIGDLVRRDQGPNPESPEETEASVALEAQAAKPPPRLPAPAPEPPPPAGKSVPGTAIPAEGPPR
jgi:hypothetical protein